MFLFYSCFTLLIQNYILLILLRILDIELGSFFTSCGRGCRGTNGQKQGHHRELVGWISDQAAVGNSSLPSGKMKNLLSESMEISTFVFGLVAGSPVVESEHWNPFPRRPLSHLHFPDGLSQEAPKPHFGIVLQVVGTPSHCNLVAGSQ